MRRKVSGASYHATVGDIKSEFGDAGFKALKQHRDTVVHARISHAPLGIGRMVGRRALIYEVLLTAEALEALSEHIFAMRQELFIVFALFTAAKAAKRAAPKSAGNAKFESSTKAWSESLLSYQKKKQSLPKLPEFPSEEELMVAEEAWFLALMRQKRMSNGSEGSNENLP